jgi:hypothetical protein
MILIAPETGPGPSSFGEPLAKMLQPRSCSIAAALSAMNHRHRLFEARFIRMDQWEYVQAPRLGMISHQLWHAAWSQRRNHTPDPGL